jgi:hypothetical protein
MPRHPELTASSLALLCPALPCRPRRVHHPLAGPPFAPGDMVLTGASPVSSARVKVLRREPMARRRLGSRMAVGSR